MKKTLKLLPFGIVSSFCLVTLPFTLKSTQADATTCRVDFFTNYVRQDFTLSSGFGGIGNSLLYQSVTVNKDSTVAKPVDPTRNRWDFAGWFKEAACENEWNFAGDIVSKNTRLFAKWIRSSSDVEPEPSYTPPSTVLDESAPENFVLNSMMGFKLEANEFRVSKSALARLRNHKEDILPLLEYKVKASATLSATYEAALPNGHIAITLNGVTTNYTVVDDSTNLRHSNVNFEPKASKYEAKIDNEDENYHVMLAGSSSMEFWETFAEDLDPIIAYNHGIGGTKVNDWREKFNQRLVYPYKPKLISYYVGINNVKDGENENTIINSLIGLFDETHQALPNTKIQYVLLNKVPLVKDRFAAVERINQAVINYQEENSTWFDTVNPGDLMLKPSGQPHTAYYRQDGIHMTLAGYEIWTDVIKKALYAQLKK